jgi:hypothetical protein
MMRNAETILGINRDYGIDHWKADLRSKDSRAVVRPAKAGALSGRQTHPGKNQKPGS